MILVAIKETVTYTVTQSLINAPVGHTTAFASLGVGAVTGNTVAVMVAILASLAVIANAGVDIYIKVKKYRNDKE